VATGKDGEWCGHPEWQSPKGWQNVGKINISNEKFDFALKMFCITEPSQK